MAAERKILHRKGRVPDPDPDLIRKVLLGLGNIFLARDKAAGEVALLVSRDPKKVPNIVRRIKEAQILLAEMIAKYEEFGLSEPEDNGDGAQKVALRLGTRSLEFASSVHVRTGVSRVRACTADGVPAC